MRETFFYLLREYIYSLKAALSPDLAIDRRSAPRYYQVDSVGVLR
jgi:hypothetical protein